MKLLDEIEAKAQSSLDNNSEYIAPPQTTLALVRVARSVEKFVADAHAAHYTVPAHMYSAISALRAMEAKP